MWRKGGAVALVDMKAMLRHAYEHGYAVGGFDVVDLSFVAGVMAAAERCRAPVILSLAESHFAHYDLETLMPAVEAAARRATVPVAIHLDHGASPDSAIRAIRLGCNGVMVDASEERLETNIARTRRVVRMAHGCGVPVEGELGYVPGVEGEDALLHPGDIAYTEVDTAVDYVAQTGVDLLAVSIGTVHGRMQGRPELDFERLKAIDDALRMPLVIHGGTGLDEAQFRGLIARGVAKINYYTALADAAASAVWDQGGTRSYAHLFRRVRDAVADETERCIRLWGGAGRAAELLSRCPAWEPVEHLITYNVQHGDDGDVAAMIAEGRRVLAAVPGVRAVEAGQAVAVDQARYRYCWLVRFASAAVIDSYRDHPLHTAFADGRFRPLAADRMSTDYRLFAGEDTHA
jgi:fructose-bisphosphate aldolase class II